jgi:hypothetical protein
MLSCPGLTRPSSRSAPCEPGHGLPGQARQSHERAAIGREERPENTLTIILAWAIAMSVPAHRGACAQRGSCGSGAVAARRGGCTHLTRCAAAQARCARSAYPRMVVCANGASRSTEDRRSASGSIESKPKPTARGRSASAHRAPAPSHSPPPPAGEGGGPISRATLAPFAAARPLRHAHPHQTSAPTSLMLRCEAGGRASKHAPHTEHPSRRPLRGLLRMR